MVHLASIVSDLGFWPTVAGTVATYLFYQIVATVYDVYFGPMSNIPGPKLWAASHIPYILMLWNGEDASTKLALHEKYGPVVRVSPTELSYREAQAWKDIYGHQTRGKKSFPKDSRFYAPAVNGAPSILNADDPTHTRHRRILAHAFSDKALKEQEPLLKKWSDMLVSKLKENVEKSPSTPLDLVSWFNFTTFDIMADLTFAEPLYMLEGSTYSPWVRTIFGSLKLGSRLRAVRILPGMTTFINMIMPNSMRQKQVEHFKYSADRVDKRLANKNLDRPDLWAQVLKRVDVDGMSMSVAEMHSNSAIFMLAGTETTATLLSGLTYHLLQNPATMSKLVNEVRSTFPTRDDINVETLQRLPYLNACLEEGMRMYPPVATGLPRLTPKGGAAICGTWIPEDVAVSVSQWSTYQCEENFHKAKLFIPERWMGEDEQFANDNHAAFQPFSTGPRNCIGRNLAYHEARLLLCEVLWNFDLTLDEKSEDWLNQPVFTVWEKDPLWVRLQVASR